MRRCVVCDQLALSFSQMRMQTLHLILIGFEDELRQDDGTNSCLMFGDIWNAWLIPVVVVLQQSHVCLSCLVAGVTVRGEHGVFCLGRQHCGDKWFFGRSAGAEYGVERWRSIQCSVKPSSPSGYGCTGGLALFPRDYSTAVITMLQIHSYQIISFICIQVFKYLYIISLLNNDVYDVYRLYELYMHDFLL